MGVIRRYADAPDGAPLLGVFVVAAVALVFFVAVSALFLMR
jgi:hypothetical protein